MTVRTSDGAARVRHRARIDQTGGLRGLRRESRESGRRGRRRGEGRDHPLSDGGQDSVRTGEAQGGPRTDGVRVGGGRDRHHRVLEEVGHHRRAVLVTARARVRMMKVEQGERTLRREMVRKRPIVRLMRLSRKRLATGRRRFRRRCRINTCKRTQVEVLAVCDVIFGRGAQDQEVDARFSASAVSLHRSTRTFNAVFVYFVTAIEDELDGLEASINDGAMDIAKSL